MSHHGATACRAGRGLSGRRWQRPFAWLAVHPCGQDAGHIGQSKFTDPGTPFAVVAIGRGSIRNGADGALSASTWCNCCNAISGLVWKQTSSGTPAMSRRAGSAARRLRQADRNLAIVLLAQLTAILLCHADRVAALLGKSGVVDDPIYQKYS